MEKFATLDTTKVWSSPELFHQGGFSLRCGAQPVLVSVLGHRVGHALVPGQVHPDLHAIGGGNVALGFDVLPGSVVAFGADKAEDLALATVFTDQGGGQAESPPGLQVGSHAEDRGGQQVDFVIDDQSPVMAVDKFKMGVQPAAFGGEHLVGGNGDGPDLLDGT